MIRRHRVDLRDTIVVAQRLYGSAATWREHGSYFLFEGGGRLDMAYLESEADAASFQGWSLSRVYVEELTQLSSPDPVMALLATLRSAEGVPCQMKCTCNPGGPGHHWVKAWAIDLGPYRTVVDPDTGLSRVFIPAKVSDNPKLLEADPRYIDRLKSVGSPQRVRAWLEGDWTVIEGAFFSEWDPKRHVIAPFPVPETWTKYRSLDWGSAVPFSVGWWTVVQDDLEHDGRILPRNAIVQYREWYGMQPGKPNVGTEADGSGSCCRHRPPRDEPGDWQARTHVIRCDRSCRFRRHFRPEHCRNHASPRRRLQARRQYQTFDRQACRRMGSVRHRLKGDDEGRPLIYFFNTCREHHPHAADHAARQKPARRPRYRPGGSCGRPDPLRLYGAALSIEGRRRGKLEKSFGLWPTPSASTNFATDAMFELELEMLDKQIGDLELARAAAAKAGDYHSVRTIDEKLERLWDEVRRLSGLEAKLDLADPEERAQIVGLPH